MCSAFSSTCSSDAIFVGQAPFNATTDKAKSCTLIPAGYLDLLTKAVNGTITITTPAPGPGPSPSSSPSSCFAGSETVLLSSGESRAISTVRVGDEIAVAAMDGVYSGYSPVIAVPHAANAIKTTFTQISTVSGRDVKMTADHLVLGGSCAAPSLVQAGSLKIGECVQTVSGAETVSAITSVISEGIYTVVTKHDGLLIVNGIVASPFAVNHLVANSFYNIVRFVYGIVPSMAKTSVVGQVISAFGDVVTGVFA